MHASECSTAAVDRKISRVYSMLLRAGRYETTIIKCQSQRRKTIYKFTHRAEEGAAEQDLI